MKDAIGQDIKVGDTVIKAAKFGSAACLEQRIVAVVDDSRRRCGGIRLQNEYLKTNPKAAPGPWAYATKMVVITKLIT